MALAHFQETIGRVLADGDVFIGSGASVEVRDETNGALAAIFVDRDGVTPKSNPFNADSQGFADFYVASGRYRVKVSINGDVTLDLRDVEILSNDISSKVVTTSTGTDQPLDEALDQRVVYIDTVTKLLALDTSELQANQLFDVQGSIFRWDGTSFVRWVDNSVEFVIYVNASTGSDSNDGLTTSTSKLTLQAAIDYLATFGPYLRGQFVIELAAGTYARGRFPDDGLPSELPIIIRGPDVGGHPNVPTASISEAASGVAADGILARGGTRIKVKDIKFTGWDGSSSVGGVQVTDAGELYTENCHFENCYWGASVLNRSNLDVKGGIFDPCGTLNGTLDSGAGTRTLFNCRHAIGTQNAGTLANGPIFRNSAKACMAQEGSTGHADYLTIHDCLRGLEANVNSRFNYTGTQFRRNIVDVFVHNSHVIGTGADYGAGADESSLRIVTNNYGATVDEGLFISHELSFSSGQRTYHSEFVDTLYSSNVNNVFHTTTLAGGMWRNVAFGASTSRIIRFRVAGTCSGTADIKRFNLRMGSALTQLNLDAATVGEFELEGNIYFTDRGEQFITFKGYVDQSSAPRVSHVVASEAITANTDITLEANVLGAGSGDNIRIYTVEATLVG